MVGRSQQLREPQPCVALNGPWPLRCSRAARFRFHDEDEPGDRCIAPSAAKLGPRYPDADTTAWSPGARSDRSAKPADSVEASTDIQRARRATCEPDAGRSAGNHGQPRADRPFTASTYIPVVGLEGPLDLPSWSCQPRARTGRKPETLSCSQTMSKSALIRKAAG